MDEQHDLDQKWKTWSRSEPKLDEGQLKRDLLKRIPERQSKRTTRLVLVAAAASILALLIGYESARQPITLTTVEPPGVVHETGPNVILVLRKGAEPIYVVTEPSPRDAGE